VVRIRQFYRPSALHLGNRLVAGEINSEQSSLPPEEGWYVKWVRLGHILRTRTSPRNPAVPVHGSNTIAVDR